MVSRFPFVGDWFRIARDTNDAARSCGLKDRPVQIVDGAGIQSRVLFTDGFDTVVVDVAVQPGLPSGRFKWVALSGHWLEALTSGAAHATVSCRGHLVISNQGFTDLSWRGHADDFFRRCSMKGFPNHVRHTACKDDVRCPANRLTSSCERVSLGVV